MGGEPREIVKEGSGGERECDAIGSERPAERIERGRVLVLGMIPLLQDALSIHFDLQHLARWDSARIQAS